MIDPKEKERVEQAIDYLIDNLRDIRTKKPKRIYELALTPNTDDRHPYILWAIEVFRRKFPNHKIDFKIDRENLVKNSKETYAKREKKNPSKDSNNKYIFFGNGGERDEETIQRTMACDPRFMEKFGDKTWIEYPVQADGKGIDIIARKDDQHLTYCFELKAPRSQDNILKAGLEISFYLEKVKGDEPYEPFFDKAIKVILVPKNSKTYQEYVKYQKDIDDFFDDYLGPIEIVTYTMTPNGISYQNKQSINEFDPRAGFDYDDFTVRHPVGK